MVPTRRMSATSHLCCRSSWRPNTAAASCLAPGLSTLFQSLKQTLCVTMHMLYSTDAPRHTLVCGTPLLPIYSTIICGDLHLANTCTSPAPLAGYASVSAFRAEYFARRTLHENLSRALPLLVHSSTQQDTLHPE